MIGVVMINVVVVVVVGGGGGGGGGGGSHSLWESMSRHRKLLKYHTSSYHNKDTRHLLTSSIVVYQ